MKVKWSQKKLSIGLYSQSFHSNILTLLLWNLEIIFFFSLEISFLKLHCLKLFIKSLSKSNQQKEKQVFINVYAEIISITTINQFSTGYIKEVSNF